MTLAPYQVQNMTIFLTILQYFQEKELEANMKIMDVKDIQGIEDEFIIYSITTGGDYNFNPLDTLTRARNGLAIIIDTDSS